MANISDEELSRKTRKFSNRKKVSRQGTATRARHYSSNEESFDKKATHNKLGASKQDSGKAAPEKSSAPVKSSAQLKNAANDPITSSMNFDPSNLGLREMKIMQVLISLGAQEGFVQASFGDLKNLLNQKSGTWIPGVINELEEKKYIIRRPGSPQKKNQYQINKSS